MLLQIQLIFRRNRNTSVSTLQNVYQKYFLVGSIHFYFSSAFLQCHNCCQYSKCLGNQKRLSVNPPITESSLVATNIIGRILGEVDLGQKKKISEKNLHKSNL